MSQAFKNMPIVRKLLPCYRLFREYFWCLRGYYRLMKIRSRREEIWLELGAGDRIGQGNWVTIDVNGTCDVYYDLSHGIPFSDNSVTKIYSSHLFEHLTPNQAALCMKECVRVLKDGGIFSIAVPNARLYIDAYLNRTHTFRGLKINSFIDYINYVSYCGGCHKNMFDSESLCHLLRHSGLIVVSEREYDPQLDLAVRRDESIYASGVVQKK